MKPTKGKVDVKKLKAQLSLSDYEKIFKALSLPIFSKGQKEWRLWDGCHRVNALEGAPKLYMYLDTRIFKCFVCSCSFDIISLVQKRLTLLKQPSSFLEAINFIMSVTGLQMDDVQRLTKPNVYDWEADLGRYIRFRHTGSTLPTYDKSILQDLFPSIPQQWLDEGISQKTMVKYCIGYYERLNQTTIPCFGQDGSLIGIRVRNWEPDRIEQAKYMPLITLDGKQYSFNTNDALYGLNYNWPEIERIGKVWICEGEKGVMKLDSWYGEKSCAVAMFGSNLGNKRRNQLVKLGVNDVTIIADCDFINNPKKPFDQWQTQIQKQVDLWKGYANVSVVWDDGSILGPKENATDHDFETWLRLYESREICS